MTRTNDWALTAEAERWIDLSFDLNVYAVLTLKQSIGTYAAGYKSWVRGDRHRYLAAYQQFIRRLSQRVYGETNWFRCKKELPNIPTIEGGRDGMLYHLNVMVQRPEWMSFEDFETAFRQEWLRSDWAMPDIFIEERTGNCTGYSLKDGLDSLLL